MPWSRPELLERLRDLIEVPNTAKRDTAWLEDVQPFDLAEALSELSQDEACQVLTVLDPHIAAHLLGHLEYVDQYHLLDHITPVKATNILDQMHSDAVVDLVGAIHPRQAKQLLSLIPPDYLPTIRSLMEYPENSAGGLMTIDYVSVRETMTLDRVLDHIRKVGSDAETVTYIYVVDGAGRLTGVLSLREIILAAARSRVADIMNPTVISVPVSMDQEEVARLVSQYDFVAIPVVSPGNRLLGIITFDDVIDVIEEEASEDAYRMGATSAPEEPYGRPLISSAWALAKPRLPWLVSLLFLEMGSSVIVNKFSALVTPAMAVMLALFTVVMAGESGNAATQALAVVVRGLATGEIDKDDLPRVVLREAVVGVIVGTITGGALMLTGWLWQGTPIFGFAVGLALATNLLIAKLLGGLFPIIIDRIGIDPAVASGPFITTLTDNTSMLVYYSITALVLGHFWP